MLRPTLRLFILLTQFANMITIILAIVTFLGGVYVGARWSEKLREIFYAIVSR
jgi:hypothetical protein